jgi:hypothetical protein
MKKKTGEARETRRLALRKELIRYLDNHHLVVVAGGAGAGGCPQCGITRTTD